MAKFQFSFCVKPSPESFFYRQVEFEELEEGVQVTCESPGSECVHLLGPDKYAEFVESIGQPPGLRVIDAARNAVKKNKRPLVFDAVHELAKVKFTWEDWDSPFYGDKVVEIFDTPQFDPPKKLFFSMLSEYYLLTEQDKERFIHDLAAQFFPEQKAGN